MPPEESTEESQTQPVPQDSQAPVQPVGPVPDPTDAPAPVDNGATTVDSTLPSTDTGTDSQETYDQGLPQTGAAPEPTAETPPTEPESSEETPSQS